MWVDTSQHSGQDEANLEAVSKSIPVTFVTGGGRGGDFRDDIIIVQQNEQVSQEKVFIQFNEYVYQYF